MDLHRALNPASSPVRRFLSALALAPLLGAASPSVAPAVATHPSSEPAAESLEPSFEATTVIDFIFFDGFETGNTCRWNGSCPAPPNDTCATPGMLVENVEAVGWTVNAADDYDLSCLVSGSGDTVHEFDLAQARAALIQLRPLVANWGVGMALRESAGCTISTDLSCVAGAYDTRYINRPNLPAGTYDVIVDGEGGAAGDYAIRYDTRAVDTTFGYWILASADSFSSIAGSPGATSVTIPLTPVGSLEPGDEWSESINLPFDFEFFGSTYSAVNATSNLLLTFDTPPTGPAAYDNDCPLDGTAPDNAIALFWDDGIAYEAAGTELWTLTQGSAPNRRFVIEFKNWDLLHCEGPSCFVLDVVASQQAILYENGDIELRYGPRQASSVPRGCGSQHLGCSATIGIEGPAGAQDFDEVSCDTDSVTDGTVSRFVAPR